MEFGRTKWMIAELQVSGERKRVKEREEKEIYLF